MAEVHKTQPLAAHGEIGNGRKEKSRDDKITSTRGSTGQAYLLRRLARDAPDVLERVKTGEIKSARAAAIEAGINQYSDPQERIPYHDQVSSPWWTSEEYKEWCLQLMEEPFSY